MAIPILICDDSGFARKQMARSLPAGWNVEVSFASHGIEALDAIRAGKGDILFLDLNMPEMDGYEVLEQIRSQDLPTLVIVVSGDIQPEARQRVIEFGALDFIKKPVDQDKLTDILSKYGILSELVDAPGAAQAEIKVDPLDSYQEIANVAMGQAADLLARLLNVFVKLPIPKVRHLEVGDLLSVLRAAKDAETHSAVCQGFIGAGIAGEALMLFGDSSFEDIARLMRFEGTLDESAERELLMDLSNVLIGAWLNGFAEQLDVQFSQGHPVILGQHGELDQLIKTRGHGWSRTLAIEIGYRIENHDIHCDLLLLFTEDSMSVLDERLGYLFS